MRSAPSRRSSAGRSNPAPEMLRHRSQVLVAPAGQIEHHQMVLRLIGREIDQPGERMRGLQRRNDTFELAAQLKRGQRLVVGGGQKRDAAEVAQPRMFGTDAGIVEAGRYRMRFVDLAVLV